jgi:peptidoglycan/LPS O-acetylase OafA/YrhL
MSQIKHSYIPTLDGWRAVAVVGVVFYHASRISIFGPDFGRLQDLGVFGVSLFFAISGLLICGRLLDEEVATGSISLKNFYLRRVFRIQPAAITYLLVLAVIGAAGILSCPLSAWVSALLNYRNFFTAFAGIGNAYQYTHHFWTLSVEEQFYLVLPLLLIITRRWRTVLLVTLCIITTVWLIVLHHFYFASHPWWGERTDMYAPALLFPATLAYLLKKEHCRVWIARLSPVLAVLAISLFFLSFFEVKSRLLWLIAIFGFPMLLLGTALHPNSFVSRLLEVRPLRFIGRMSYSIYLWQQIFIVNSAELAKAHLQPKFFQIFPVNILLLVVTAWASYSLIEKPMIKVGRRMSSGRFSSASATDGFTVGTPDGGEGPGALPLVPRQSDGLALETPLSGAGEEV